MPLPSCQCNAGLPIQQQLGNIYCALYTLNTGGGGPDGGFVTLNGVQTVTNKTLVDPIETGTTTAGRIVATSTTHEHILVGDYVAGVLYENAGVLLLKHTDAVNGASAIRCFGPGTTNEYGAFGVGGTFGTGLYDACFWEGSDEQNQGSGKPIRIIQRSTLGGTKTYDSAKRYEVSNASGGVQSFYNSTGTSVLLAITDTLVKVGNGVAGGGRLQVPAVSLGGDGGIAFLSNAGTAVAAMYTTGNDDNCYIDLALNQSGLQTVNAGRNTLLQKFGDNGDFETLVVGTGFVMKSPNGSRWRLTVSNAGVVGATAL